MKASYYGYEKVTLRKVLITKNFKIGSIRNEFVYHLEIFSEA